MLNRSDKCTNTTTNIQFGSDCREISGMSEDLFHVSKKGKPFYKPTDPSSSEPCLFSRLPTARHCLQSKIVNYALKVDNIHE